MRCSWGLWDAGELQPRAASWDAQLDLSQEKAPEARWWMLWDPVPGSKPLFLLFSLSDAYECESACAEPSKHQCCAVVADSICGKVHGASARFGEPPLLCAAQPLTASSGLGLSRAWGLLGL